MTLAWVQLIKIWVEPIGFHQLRENHAFNNIHVILVEELAIYFWSIPISTATFISCDIFIKNMLNSPPGPLVVVIC